MSTANSKHRKRSADTNEITENGIYDPEPFYTLMDMYFDRNSQVLVSHHINSYNQFIGEIIPNILRGDHIISDKISENRLIRNRFTFDEGGLKPAIMENDEDLMY